MNPTLAGRICDGALLGFAFALSLSTAVSEILLGLTVVAWLATAPWRRAWPRGLVALAWATAALAAAWLLSCVTAADPVASLVKSRKLYSILLVFIVADRACARRTADRLMIAGLAGGAVSALGGLVAYLLKGGTPDHRMRGVFSTAMTSGNVYAMLALVALGEVLAAARRFRFAAGAAFAAIGAGLAFTMTRSSWLAFAAGAVVLLARRHPRWLLAGIVGVGLFLALGPAPFRERARSIVDPTHVTNAGRISLWKSGLAVFADHPWTVVGLADHKAVILEYRRPDATFPAGHFHNNVVQIAASTGTIGLVAYAAWMLLLAALLVAAARRPGGERALAGAAVWLAFQVHGMFDWSFGDVEVANHFFLWTGLGLAALAAGATNTSGAVIASPSTASE